MAEELLFTKIVDKSALTHGITIPVAYQKALFDKLGFFLRRGEARPITIQIGGYLFDDATLANEAFDEIKYPNRADIVQIRYGANSLLARKLRELFGSTSELLDEIYTHRQTAKTSLIIPEDKREYIIIYAEMVQSDLIVLLETMKTIMCGQLISAKKPRKERKQSQSDLSGTPM